MNNSIGAKLRILRKGRKLTQEQLSDKIGLSRSALSSYEIGRRLPNLNDLKRFAEFYGVGLDYFGVVSKDEMFDLLSRARDIFESDAVSAETKREIYEEIMRLYLKI